MPRQSGVFKIEGKLDEYSFYKTKRGTFVRMKGGVSGNRIKNDPNFQRTRENGKEFGTAAGAAKLVRRALSLLLTAAKDGTMANRLMSQMTKVKALDQTSDRGERSVAIGFTSPDAKRHLIGFEFYQGVPFNDIVKKAYSVNTQTGEITLTGLNPGRELVPTAGATHVSFSGGWAKVDFDTSETQLVESNSVELALNAAPTTVTLTPASVPTQTTGISLFLLRVEFLQQFNGKLYPLSDTTHNVLTVAEVA